MLIRLVILLATIAWLIASIPQSMFLWTATEFGPKTFDYWAGMVRAVIIDFLPLGIVFLESELEKAHLKKAKRSYDRKADDWKEVTDFENWARTKYPTPEQSVKKRLPLLFGLVTLVIAVSYEAYYAEYGKDLALYHSALFGLNIGGFVKVLVHGIYLSIAALVTYTFGRLSSAMEVHLIFSDIGKMLFPAKKVKASPSIPKKQKAKTEPCQYCDKMLQVGKDGTTKRAMNAHRRACPNYEEGDY